MLRPACSAVLEQDLQTRCVQQNDMTPVLNRMIRGRFLSSFTNVEQSGRLGIRVHTRVL